MIRFVRPSPRLRRSAAFCLAVFTFASVRAAAAQEQSPPPTPGSTPALAQAAAAKPKEEWWRDISFGATLEGYYEFNFNEPSDRINLLRAYDTRANSFGFQQAAVVIDAAPDVDKGRRYGMRVDLQFGQATETVQGSPVNEPRPDVYRQVWQAYGTYVFPVSRGLQVDFGKFASNLGYETNYAKDNQAFSRAYLFNFLPFYHSGARVSLPLNETFTVMYMLTNGIQQTEDFNDFKSQQVSVVLKPTSTVTATANYFFGREQPDHNESDGPDGEFRVIDAYVTYTPTAALTVGADVSRTTNEVRQADESLRLIGVGAYARYQVNSLFAAGARYEWIDDEGLFAGLDQKLQEITLTGEFKLADGFLVRGEYRRDWSSEGFFPAPTVDRLRRHQNTALVGLVWWVGNKSGTW